MSEREIVADWSITTQTRELKPDIADSVRCDWNEMLRLEQIRSRHQLWNESVLPNSEYTASWSDVQVLLAALNEKGLKDG